MRSCYILFKVMRCLIQQELLGLIECGLFFFEILLDIPSSAFIANEVISPGNIAAVTVQTNVFYNQKRDSRIYVPRGHNVVSFWADTS